METLFTEIHFLPCKKMLGDGQVTMRYEVSPNMTVGTNNKVQMAHLLVWTLEKGIFLVLDPQLL